MWVPFAFRVPRVRPWALLFALCLDMFISLGVALIHPGQSSWGHFSAPMRNFLVPGLLPQFVLSGHPIFHLHTQPWILMSAEYGSVIVD